MCKCQERGIRNKLSYVLLIFWETFDEINEWMKYYRVLVFLLSSFENGGGKKCTTNVN